MRRFIFVVLDGVGAGELPDAAEYGDTGSNTLGNLSQVIPLSLPFLERAGLGAILPIRGVPPVRDPLFLPGRLAPHSVGKDTTVGHWEHMGLITSEPFPTYPDGFPDEIIRAFTAGIGRGVLGNKPASGTAIIGELGEEHLATGRPIVYTSADSVFQIAAHTDVASLDQLYSWCMTARELLRGTHAVARVIARPFAGPVGGFVRTKDRRDFSLPPPGPTYLEILSEAGLPVVALGKISEVFADRGVSQQVKVTSNDENLTTLCELVEGRSRDASFDHGLAMTNLVEFDMVWGHRNDVEGFAAGLAAVDAALPRLLRAMRPDDRLIITADHGVDPCTPSTDHSREYVPLLLYPRPNGTPGAVYEGAFADTGATVCTYLTGRPSRLAGTSLATLSPERGWRDYTPVRFAASEDAAPVPMRVGRGEALGAALWLERELGPAPDVAVVLGSGLVPALDGRVVAEVAYQDVPHWLSGRVPGHQNMLAVLRHAARTIVLLKGRVHEYEGYDVSEVQLAVRTLAGWGVKNVVLTSACGAVAEGLKAGVVAIDEVAELQMLAEYGQGSGYRQVADTPHLAGFPRGTHASLPGPQYETPAELELLRSLGVSTVSMSPAAELRAAHEEGMRAAVLAVAVNAGDTTHEEVLRESAAAAEALGTAVDLILEAWGSPTSIYYEA